MALHALFIGLGSMGSRHLANLLDLAPGIRISILHSQEREKTDLEKRADAAIFHDLDAALAKRPDIVFICTPTALHLKAAIAAADAGCALFIEKPVAVSLEGMDKLIDICHKKRLTTFVAYCLRFYPDLLKIKELIDDGTIGRPLSATICYGSYFPDWKKDKDYRQDYRISKALGGGVLLDLSHEVDYTCWILGMPTSVIASLGNASDFQMETEDCADIILEFPNAVRAVVHIDYFQKPGHRFCEIRGSEGTISWSLEEGNLRVYASGEWKTIDCKELRKRNMYQEELKHFIECVKEKKQTAIPVEEGARILRVLDAARKSSSTKQQATI